LENCLFWQLEYDYSDTKRMLLTDTHCHLDFTDFDKDRSYVITRAQESGVERILIPGIDLKSSQSAVEIAKANRSIFASVGIHPSSANFYDHHVIGRLKELAKQPKVVAIGEIGLDYYRDRTTPGIQKKAFKAQLRLAEQEKLPVVVHTRNANSEDRTCIADTLEILAEFELIGVLHSFSGNRSEAERALELGFYMGITGPVTYKSAVQLQKVVETLPLERLLIETDSPFLTPVPYRGKRNEPSNVKYIAEKISEIHNQSPDIVAEITAANAGRLFRWSNA
jgi:TatD DNase family protein